jgi:amino acid transporter
MRWKNFDHWWVKAVAFVVVLLCLWWMLYAAWWHYHLEHQCKCPVSWEYFPYIISGLFLLFALSILARKLTEGAASVVLPFATLIIERFGPKKEVTMTVKPPAPGQPPAGNVTVTPAEDPVPDRGDKP